MVTDSYKTEPSVFVSRSETEMNRGWATANPELFSARVWRFQEEFPIDDWKHTMDMSRNGTIKLIAIRREVPYDVERDYLNEIGMK